MTLAIEEKSNFSHQLYQNLIT